MSDDDISESGAYALADAIEFLFVYYTFKYLSGWTDDEYAPFFACMVIFIIVGFFRHFTKDDEVRKAYSKGYKEGKEAHTNYS